MNKVMMRQLVLERKGDGARLVTWVDDRPDLKWGAFVTLKDSENPKDLWKIVGWDDKPHERSSFVDSHSALSTFKSVEGRQTKKDLRK